MQQVVNWAYDRGMYVIINIHHDEDQFMPSSAHYHIYRSLSVYQPDTDLTAITPPSAHSAEALDGAWYNLQGMRVTTPRKGVYLRNKRKVVVR